MTKSPDILHMPRGTFFFYSFVFFLGAALAVYVIWWRQTWVDATIAALAVFFIVAPLTAWREFRFATTLEKEHAKDLQAQMIVSNEMLQRTRDHDRQQLEIALAERTGYVTRVLEENKLLQGDKDELLRKWLPFDATARKQARLAKQALDEQVRITAEQETNNAAVITIEGHLG